MSFDIYLQAFDDASVDVPRLSAYLEPMLDEARGNVITPDGQAEVYGLDHLATGLMFTHASGTAIWDVIHTVATIAHWAVIPVGCPVCLVDPDQAASLPPELVDAVGYQVVRSGADIRRAIETGD